jgi:hypothetical protein
VPPKVTISTACFILFVSGCPVSISSIRFFFAFNCLYFSKQKIFQISALMINT